jgi:uncharacterized protein (TIGR02001 family)
MRFSMISLGVLALASAMPAMAQEASEATEPAAATTVTGSFGVTTDYRFRGLSQSNQKAAGQATINVNHESGLYVGTWASTISENSLPGYGEAEVDLYGGYTKTLDNGLGFDVGLLYYLYPLSRDTLGGVANDTDFFEPYASVNYTLGPVNVKVGANYAWSGQAGLGDDDSLYLYSNLAATIPNTPVKLLGHVGRSNGALGAFNLDATDESYLDWSLGAEVGYKGFTLGVSYVDTDITDQRLLGEKFSNLVGGDSTILGYITYAF